MGSMTVGRIHPLNVRRIASRVRRLVNNRLAPCGRPYRRKLPLPFTNGDYRRGCLVQRTHIAAAPRAFALAIGLREQGEVSIAYER
jgi:hypothetical protein